MKILKKFLAATQQWLFTRRLNREIYGKIFPHLRGETGQSYRFHSHGEIVESNMRAFLATESMVRLIERAASKMPKSEGDAFRHIAYRDLQKCMWMYVQFAHERMHSHNRQSKTMQSYAAA